MQTNLMSTAWPEAEGPISGKLMLLAAGFIVDEPARTSALHISGSFPLTRG